MEIYERQQAGNGGVKSQGDLGKKLFGSSIRSTRRLRGISQDKLAERAGLHRTYVCDIERGMRNVSLENILRLAAALDIPVVELFAPFTKETVAGAGSGAKGIECRL